MKIRGVDGRVERQRVMVSHFGALFLDPVRKAMGIAFGTSGKNGKEFMRISVANGDMVDLIGVQEGVSSPFIPTAKYANFARVGVVFDTGNQAEVLAIAASRNTTLLIPRLNYESVMTNLAEADPRLIVLRFPLEP